MNRMLVACALALLAAGPVLASENSEVMAPIHQFIDGFNKGDVASALAACADQTSIIDDFPPHEWHGAGACATWAKDYGADAASRGITDEVVGIGTPVHVDVTGDRAYVVVPASDRYKQKGKLVKLAATMTLALQKTATGWHITGWTWSRK